MAGRVKDHDQVGGIPSRLERARTSRGLSHRGVRDVVAPFLDSGPSHSSVGKYESGETEPPAKYIAAFCRALQISPDWLLWDQGIMDWSDPSDAERLLRAIQDLMEMGPISADERTAARSAEDAWRGTGPLAKNPPRDPEKVTGS